MVVSVEGLVLATKEYKTKSCKPGSVMRSADGGHNYRLVIGLESVFLLDLGKRADKRGTGVNVPIREGPV